MHACKYQRIGVHKHSTTEQWIVHYSSSLLEIDEALSLPLTGSWECVNKKSHESWRRRRRRRRKDTMRCVKIYAPFMDCWRVHTVCVCIQFFFRGEFILKYKIMESGESARDWANARLASCNGKLEQCVIEKRNWNGPKHCCSFLFRDRKK